MFDMLPSDDAKSWVLRMAHLGILAGLVTLGFIVLLFLINVYLIYSLRVLRLELRTLASGVKQVLKQR
jgi:hypothetical protein